VADFMTTLGVLADTHIPDRAPQLNPQVIQRFHEAGVSGILYAGDVSIPRVLQELEQVAPVHAVRGNRDIFYLRNLPLQIRQTFDGISIGMAHGHGTFSRYMIDKIHRLVYGKLIERYIKRMLQAFPDVNVIVFGHLHLPCNFHLDSKLLFNPGSTSSPWPKGDPASFGLLHLEPGKEPQGEIIEIKA
jgi:putative phosphoesterase